MSLIDAPRFRLAHLPTPLVAARRLSEALGGPEVWLKRDDLTGLAGGGNKTRKLEYSVGRALAEGCTDLVTEGSIHSNHCRQTASAAARAGLGCHLVLNAETVPELPQGNLLRDRLFGAGCHFVGTGSERASKVHEVAASLKQAGRKVLVIPTGASDETGCLGYASAALELQHQLWSQELDADWVYTGSCSGGTHAGLMLGQCWYGLEVPVRAVLAAGVAEEERELVHGLATRAGEAAGRAIALDREMVICDDSQVGQGYGIATEACLEAIGLVAKTEGVLLDPVYSGKAMAGLVADVRSGRLSVGERVVFIHTGGQASLDGKVDQLLPLLGD
ncbi:D-cysteine desulfhydrase family protein [Mucisphaera sp.]|uniref:D-cysteine desulfhydrase family protein n=1 Tax=Mucisphaera sp. TaxID=2913024 RepID=UPI003D0C196E